MSWQGFEQDVVERASLEELNSAVGDPLVRCVLVLKDQASNKGGPLEDAECFLRLVYDKQPNLARLRPIFEDLYKHFGSTPSGWYGESWIFLERVEKDRGI